jgi:hypothetical protein
VLAAALWAAAAHDAISTETGLTLLATTILAALMTRRGDLVLVVIYPPLAFMTSVLIAGQLLVDHGHTWRTSEALMLVETLGRNAKWVIAATITGAALVGLRTLMAKLRAKRAPTPALAE